MDTFTVVIRAILALCCTLGFASGVMAFGLGLLHLPGFIALNTALVAVICVATEGLE